MSGLSLPSSCSLGELRRTIGKDDTNSTCPRENVGVGKQEGRSLFVVLLAVVGKVVTGGEKVRCANNCSGR